jgi:cell division transport system permease protein
MSQKEERFNKRRLRTSYFTVIVSISLVLFMMGLVGLIILQAQKLSAHVKENIGFTVILKEDVKEVEVARLQKSLDASRYVHATEYIDREEAAQQLQEDLGEDFVDFLGYNPLLASIDVNLKAEYANPDSLSWIETDLMQNPKVKEVFYQRNLVALVNENVQKISLVLLGFSALLLIIAIALINNSIRLAIYSRRFLIRSMQLVGATRSFIRRPFIWRGVLNGVYGSIIAIGFLSGVIYFAQSEVPELFDIQDQQLFLTLFGIVLLLGVLITWLSTFFVVSRYLRIKTDKLYQE